MASSPYATTDRKQSLVSMSEDAARDALARAKPTLDVLVVSCSGPS